MASASRRMPSVPDGWFDYAPFGAPIAKSRIIAVKTPLKQAFNNGKNKTLQESQPVDYNSGVPLEDEFTPTQLVERLKGSGLNLCAVIDLTYTKRYYNPEEFVRCGVKHAKIMCPGREIPNDNVYTQFTSALREFLEGVSEGGLVAVHCTHGLNRTGYLVCRYLIEYCSFAAEDAIQGFNKARGYDIERVNYLEHLRKGCPPLLPKSLRENSSHHRQRPNGQISRQHHNPALTYNKQPSPSQNSKPVPSTHPYKMRGKPWHPNSPRRNSSSSPQPPSPQPRDSSAASPVRGGRRGGRRHRRRGHRQRGRNRDQSRSEVNSSHPREEGVYEAVNGGPQPAHFQRVNPSQWSRDPHEFGDSHPCSAATNHHWIPPSSREREPNGSGSDYDPQHCVQQQEHFPGNDVTPDCQGVSEHVVNEKAKLTPDSSMHSPAPNTTQCHTTSAAVDGDCHQLHDYSRTFKYVLVAVAITAVTAVIVYKVSRN